MRIISVASEMAPFAKTGGLADVAGSLPHAVMDHGVGVVTALPYYRDKVEKVLRQNSIPLPLGTLASYEIDWAGKIYLLELITCNFKGMKVIFVKNDELFNRNELYITVNHVDGKEVIDGYSDNFKRFALFSKAISLHISESGYDAVHTHDWQTALVPIYLKDEEKRGKNVPKLVHTIHNLAFQGLFPMEEYRFTGLSNELLNDGNLEAWGKLNLLKGAVNYSDSITTVSPTYAKEIQTDEYGCGLEGFLQEKSGKIKGILNGIDKKIWDPVTDPYLGAFNYKSGDRSAKADFKAEFCREQKMNPELPLFVMVSRLTHQKGLDILLEALEEMLKMELSVFILGSGDPRYEKKLAEYSARYPDRVGFNHEFNDPLAHRIYAAGDFFLMPSVFEPCGLGQLIAMRYGALPVVRATGGLKDTVRDLNDDPKTGTGFVFSSLSSRAFLAKVRSAINLYAKPDFDKAVNNAFSADFSWNRSADEYIKLYKEGKNR